MRPRLIAILALIVFVPLALVLWLGVRMARNERDMLELRMQEILVGRLRDVDGDIQEVLSKQGRALLQLPALPEGSPEALRQLTGRLPAVSQLFVLDATGMPLFPPPGGPLTEDEVAFIDRTRDIWLDREIPPRAGEQTQTPALPPSSLRSKSDGPYISKRGAVKGAPVSSEYGWYPWFWGSGIHLIYWWRLPNGNIAGAELNGPRLTSEIINALPETDPRNPSLPDGRIVLRDAKGMPIYQWGLHQPDPAEPARASLTLSPPLSAWRLDYYTSDGTTLPQLGRSVVFNLFSGVVVLALAVLAMAGYFYRENAREMREAAQRISFVNQVSHELKTPLTNIRMYAEMLEEELETADDRARRHLGVIVSESRRLSRLIGNVLTFSRKQRHALRLRPLAGVIDGFVQGVLDHTAEPLKAKGFDVEWVKGAPEEARFDPDIVEQVLGNLLSNVEKYASSGKRVRVTTAQIGDYARITVADDGPGIPPRERARIFDAFYRISNRLTDGVAGTGIGLTIARDLARLHGGDVVLEDSAQGACFSFTFHAPRTERGSTS